MIEFTFFNFYMLKRGNIFTKTPLETMMVHMDSDGLPKGRDEFFSLGRLPLLELTSRYALVDLLQMFPLSRHTTTRQSCFFKCFRKLSCLNHFSVNNTCTAMLRSPSPPICAHLNQNFLAEILQDFLKSIRKEKTSMLVHIPYSALVFARPRVMKL